MNIVDFYSGILTSLGLHVDPETAVVYINRPGLLDPIKIDGKILVLPTQKNLMSGAEYAQKHIYFHPISQSLIRKESKVMKKLRAIINVRLYEILVALLEVNAKACANNFSDTTASPAQLKLMAALSAEGVVTDKFIAALGNVLNATNPNEGHKLINIYIRKGALEGKNYSAVANVTFPILEESAADKPKIFGVNVHSKANMRIIRELFTWIIPNCETEHAYSRGSCDLTAPNFHALMLSLGALAETLNIAVHESRNVLPNADALMMDLSWMEGLNYLAKWSTDVPSQPGNEGEPMDDAGSNPSPTTIQADALANPQMASQFAMPKLGAPLPGLAPTTTAQQPVTTDAPKKQLIGSPLTAAFAQPKEQSGSFRPPVGGQAINHSRAQLDTSLQNQELELKLREEALALAAKNMQMQTGTPMPMMPQMPMPNMMPQMSMQMPQMGMPNMMGMPQMANSLYAQLMGMLQQQYPPIAQTILGNPQLNQLLYQYPQICQAVMQQPMLISNPQVLFQMVQNLQSGVNGGYGMNSGQALAQGTTVGRMIGEQQRAKRENDKMIMEHQKHLAALQQQQNYTPMGTSFNTMGALTPQQLAMMQFQMQQTGMPQMGMQMPNANYGVPNMTPAPVTTPFGTTM